MRLLVASLLLVSLTACGGEPARQSQVIAPDEFIARATVLDNDSHGPQLCLGAVMESMPPQCGGPDLVGWDWAKTKGFKKRANTTWGAYVVIGSYDATKNTFTPTRKPVLASRYRGALPSRPEPAPRSTPCKAPAGGWRVVDPALTTEQSMNRTFRVAESRRDFGGLWLDQSINPASKGETTEEKAILLNDPAKLILNVAVTGYPAAAEADLRRVWGGALCVTRSKHTDRHLRRIQDAIATSNAWLSVSSGHDVVDVHVIWDDGSLQRRFDKRYGKGTVRVSSALQPYRR